MNRQTKRQMNRQTGRQTDGQTNRQVNRQTDEQTDRQMNRQTDEQTDRQTDRWCEWKRWDNRRQHEHIQVQVDERLSCQLMYYLCCWLSSVASQHHCKSHSTPVIAQPQPASHAHNAKDWHACCFTSNSTFLQTPIWPEFLHKEETTRKGGSVVMTHCHCMLAIWRRHRYLLLISY